MLEQTNKIKLHERTNGNGYLVIWYRHLPLTVQQYGHEFHETLESAQASITEILRYAEEQQNWAHKQEEIDDL